MTRDKGPILSAWERLQKVPGGKALFNFYLGRKVPYTGTIHARVEELSPGHCRVRMSDRKGLRNHLRSIHAIALANLGELATGLAVMAALPPDARGIPIEIKVEFLKKARGEIIAKASCTAPDLGTEHEHPVEALMLDAEGDKVARFSARWMVGPGS